MKRKLLEAAEVVATSDAAPQETARGSSCQTQPLAGNLPSRLYQSKLPRVDFPSAANRFGWRAPISPTKTVGAGSESEPTNGTSEGQKSAGSVDDGNAAGLIISSQQQPEIQGIQESKAPLSTATGTVNARQSRRSVRVRATSTSTNAAAAAVNRGLKTKGRGASVVTKTLPPTKASSLVSARRKSMMCGPIQAILPVEEKQLEAFSAPVTGQEPLSHSDNINDKENRKEMVRAAFERVFSKEVRSQLEAQLHVRAKTRKFDHKGRCEEQRVYICDMKGILRDMNGKMREFDDIASSIDHQIINEKQRTQMEIASLLRTEKVLKDRVMHSKQQFDGLKNENQQLVQQIQQLEQLCEQRKKAEEEAIQSCRLIEAQISDVRRQLEIAQQEKGRLLDEMQAASSRSQAYEERDREFQKKKEELKERFEKENQRLEEDLRLMKEQILAIKMEKDLLKTHVDEAQKELREERDQLNQSSHSIVKLETELQSARDQVASAASEIEELKLKVKQKEAEMSNLLQNMTQIQSFATTTNGVLENEKRALAEKNHALEAKIQEMQSSAMNLSSRLHELRSENELLKQEQEKSEARVEEATQKLLQAQNDLQEKTQQTLVEKEVRAVVESQLMQLRTEQIAVNAQLEAVKAEQKQQMKANEESHERHTNELSMMESKFHMEKASLQKQIEILQEQKVSLESEVSTLRQRASNASDASVEELCELKREAEVLRLRMKEMQIHGTNSLSEKDSIIAELQGKVREGEKLRRTMHNTIQELRGNVRVFARTRPFIPNDGQGGNHVEAIMCEYDGETLKLSRPSKSTSRPGEAEVHTFKFDKVFTPSAGQDTVFEEISELVQSALDGYHVCLFSYGQTGSGKTHTMLGSGHGQMRGIIPRAIERVLADCAQLESEGWIYRIEVSFLEIYNETLKDLLVNKQEQETKKLAIKKDPKGGVYVTDLARVRVSEIREVEALMERASRARSVACTDMNATSSRSHSVFTLHIQGEKESAGTMLDGKLHLVDLAGSERASRSHVEGDRLKETQSINKSLSCLADVFTAIGNKSAHIPFRNSKLTYLLQSSLSGDGKTVMMVNLSPTLESAAESLCSLRFASQVNKCELGKPKRQIRSRR